MEEEGNFTSIVEDISPPKCPIKTCGSTDVVVTHSKAMCCECGHVGSTPKFVTGNTIAVAMYAQEGFDNLLPITKGSLKTISLNVGEQKGFPGANTLSGATNFGVARGYVSMKDDYGNDVNLADHFNDRAIQLFKLSSFDSLDKMASVSCQNRIEAKEPGSMFVTTTRVSLGTGIEFKKGTAFPVSPENEAFGKNMNRNKVGIVIESNLKEDESMDVKIYSAAYGRPDIIFSNSYTKHGGQAEGVDGSITISDKSLLWQPFFWPSLTLESDVIIRLVGVIQSGLQNFNYVVTESMDTGEFYAGLYKRVAYTHEMEFVKSKAETVETAIQRLRTSFEKTVLTAEQSGAPVDFSWICDWNYEVSLSSVFRQIVKAPFWAAGTETEMYHILGVTKEAIVQEIFDEMKDVPEEALRQLGLL